MVEAKLFLELLMRLLTDPSGFDRGGERLQARVGPVGLTRSVFARQSTGARQRATPRRPACTARDYRAYGACGRPQRGHDGPRRDMSKGGMQPGGPFQLPSAPGRRDLPLRRDAKQN
jgi:hypothetical protein